jgi:hypothetical protein
VDTGLSLDPGNDLALEIRVYALVEMGRTNEAAALFKRPEAHWLSLSDEDTQYVRLLVPVAADGDRDARSSLNAIMTAFADPAGDWNGLQDGIILLLPAVNRRFGKDAALDLLILSTKRGATMPYDMLMLRPDLKELRADPRARDVIQKTKVSFDTLMRILQGARARGELPSYLNQPLEDLQKLLKERGGTS